MDNQEMLSLVKKKRMIVFIAPFIAYFFMNFHKYAAAVLAPDIVKEFSLDPVAAGMLGAIYMYSYALTNLPGGLITDTIGVRRTLTIATGVMAIGAILSAAAPSYNLVLFGRLLVGMSCATVFPPASRLIADWSAKKEFASIQGTLFSVGRLGGILATAPLAFMMVAIGWRGSFWVIVILTLMITVLAHLTVKNSPSDVGLVSPEQIEGNETGQRVKENPFKGLGEILSKPQIWILLLFFIANNGSALAITATWGGLFLQNGVGLTKGASSSILFFAAICGMVGGVVGGLLCDKVFKSNKKTGIMAMLLFIIVYLYLGLFTDNLSVIGLYICIGGVSFLDVIGVLGGFSIARTMVPARLVGTTIGFINFVTWLAGAGFTTQMWGYLVKGGEGVAPYSLKGFHTAFLFQLVIIVVGLVAISVTKVKPLDAFVKSGEIKETTITG